MVAENSGTGVGRGSKAAAICLNFWYERRESESANNGETLHELHYVQTMQPSFVNDVSNIAAVGVGGNGDIFLDFTPKEWLL